MHTCHICIHMFVIDTYAYICTHIQYTEQTIDYQKPEMCISNYLFFSDGSPRLLLENTCEVMGPVSFSLPHPLSTGSSYSCPVQAGPFPSSLLAIVHGVNGAHTALLAEFHARY